MSSSQNSDIIYVGRKPTMSYVLAGITRFTAPDTEVVLLKARGRAITTAVDVAEIARSRFMKELKIGKISIGTEEMPPREGEGKPRMVSTMEIKLSRK